MKKIISLLLFGLFSLCFLSSCSDDDDEQNNNPLVGKWIFKEVTADVKTNSPANDVALKKYIVDYYSDENSDYEIEFKDNEMCIVDGDEFPYTLVNGTITVKFREDDIEYFKLVGNEIYIDDEDNADYYNSWELDMIMNRLGLSAEDAANFQVEKALFKVILKKQ